jgi:TolA-binding protein
MEIILVWTLVIAAIAIIVMLVLLIASESEVKRKRADVESLRSRSDETGSGARIEARREVTAGRNRKPYAEIAALTEQLQSSQADVETLWIELERLRAENDRLKQESARYRSESPELGAQIAESAPSAPVEEPAVRAADQRPIEIQQDRRPMYAAAAVVVLLMAGAAIYYTEAWHFATLGLAGRDTPVAEQPSNTTIARDHAGAASAEGNKSTETTTPRRNAAATKSAVLRGARYEVVRSTRVFSQPNDRSSPLARVEAGMEINVVGARDEWLEVRSRHGRPPGFIKRDTAVRKDLN